MTDHRDTAADWPGLTHRPGCPGDPCTCGLVEFLVRLLSATPTGMSMPTSPTTEAGKRLAAWYRDVHAPPLNATDEWAAEGWANVNHVEGAILAIEAEAREEALRLGGARAYTMFTGDIDDDD